MTSAARDAEIAEIDRFLAETKRLQGPHPEWVPSARPSDLEAYWNLEDSLGIVKAQLRFRCTKVGRMYPTVSLIFRSNPIWRIEIEDPPRPTSGHPNPPWAYSVGCPALVIGSHEHSWSDNRNYIKHTSEWDIPCRRPIEPQIKKLSQAIPWFADRIGLKLDHEQRGFDVPPRSELFE